MIRVLVVEDLPTARQLVVGILSADPEIEVIGEAADGAEAVELVRKLQPDAITMDVLMPRLDGFHATKAIMSERPTPIVMVTSLDTGEMTFTMHALGAGALAALPKPRGPGSPGFAEDARRLTTTVKAMSRVALFRRPASPARATPAPAAVAAPRAAGGRVVAIAASTGGPAALQRIVARLPADLPVPVLVVQHIALGFARGFAEWLRASGAVRVKVAAHDEPLEPGTVYVAADDRHLGVAADGARVIVSADPPVGGFRPSGTFLFRSVAGAFGAGATAVVLSGMGRDGVDGLASVRSAGGLIVAQDEASSAVHGMPGAAIAAGLADATLSPHAIAELLARMAGARSPPRL